MIPSVKDVYPESNRKGSRPYRFTFGDRDKTPAEDIEKRLHIFQEALFEIGLGLAKDSGNPRLDFDWDPKRYENDSGRFERPPFWYTDYVTEFSETQSYVDYRNSMPEPARQALDVIVGQAREESYFSEEARDNHGNIRREPGKGYTPSKLAAALKELWKHNILLDSRLTEAEDFFLCGIGGIEIPTRKSSMQREFAQLRSNLEWMAHPENAPRIALAFFYSRLAQHLGESDPKALDAARFVAARLMENEDLGPEVIMEAVQAPWLRREPKIEAAVPSRLSVANLIVVAAKLITAAPKPSAPPYDVWPGLREVSALQKSAPRMLEDYKRLRSGSWARQELQNLDDYLRKDVKSQKPEQNGPELQQ
jgi:hypothetical protein